MYGIFMQCWVAMKLYGGNGAIFLLFLASAIYILVTEQSIKKKIKSCEIITVFII